MTGYEDVESNMLKLFPEVLSQYCELTGRPEELMRSYTSLEFVHSESRYCPYPELFQDKPNSRDISIVCSVDAMLDTWEPVFAEIDDVDTETSRKLYIASGLAYVGLAHVAIDSRERRSTGYGANLKQISSIMRQLHNKKVVTETLQQLEVAEKIDSDLQTFSLEDKDILDVNRLRYGLGVAYLILDIDESKRQSISHEFVSSFSLYLRKMGMTLIDFAEAFAMGKKMDIEEYRQRGQNKAFHWLYFAGIYPMDMSEIMGV